MVTFEDVKKNEEVQALIQGAQKQLDELGYTEHSHRHIEIVSRRAGDILEKLGYDKHTVELAKIAGYLHDIGNCVNRVDHAHSGAIMAYNILKEMGMPVEDRAQIMMAIGNHDEGTGVAVNEVAAALIIADKSDVRRSRVRNNDVRNFDIHDRVNFSVENSSLSISDNKKYVTLELKIDTSISPIMDYFEIFLGRMLMCRKAAQKLGLEFILRINDQQLI